ncbi:MAG TPA: PH domain-containing protein [Blastocatellia bacterium]|nr:PH domain-containing protein [Blastocatellia bacterium]
MRASDESRSEPLRIDKIYCNRCGQPLPRDSLFCSRCGSRVVAVNDKADDINQSLTGSALDRAAWLEEDRKPARIVTREDDDREIFSISPTMIFVYLWYALAAAVVLVVAAVVGLLGVSPAAAFIIIAAAAVVAFALPVYKHILRRREVYTLLPHTLQMRFGLLSRTVRNIPLANVQDVTVTAAFWQRLLHLGDIEIDSAAEGGKIVLNDIHYPDRYASMILAELRRRN